MRIKPIRSTVEPTIAPTVRAPLDITSGFAQGLGQFGETLGDVGDVIGQIAVQKKLVDDSVFLTDLKNRANLSYAEHHNNLRTTPNYKKLDEIDKTGLEAILQQFNDEAQAINPEVAAAWKEMGGALNIKGLIGGMPIKRDRFKQNAIAGAFTLMNSRRDEAVAALTAGDTKTANAIFNEVDEAVNFLRDNMGVSALSAETWKDGFKNEVEAEKTLQETAFKRLLREAEVKADKAQKAEMEANFGKTVTMYSEGTLTEAYINGLIKTRKIDPDKGLKMADKLRADAREGKEVAENNPVVVGGLATDIELGLDVAERLDIALINEEIKSETYIGLKAKVADRDFRRGLGYINSALKPGAADKWTPDKNVRHAEAIDAYRIRAASPGVNPIEAAREIVSLNTTHVRRSIAGLSRPRFLAGDKTNLMDLALAKTTTVGKYQDGTITVEEFDHEAKLIRMLEDLVGEMTAGDQINSEMSDRVKQSENLRNR